MVRPRREMMSRLSTSAGDSAVPVDSMETVRHTVSVPTCCPRAASVTSSAKTGSANAMSAGSPTRRMNNSVSGPAEQAELLAAEHVQVRVKHGPTCVGAGVEDQPVTGLVDFREFGDLGTRADHLGEQLRIARGQLPRVLVMLLR